MLRRQRSRFVVEVTTLSMGLKTFKIEVGPETTVSELKALIQQQDESCPPPDRQRLIYNKTELRDPSTPMSRLNPPARVGAKFSMAWELTLDEQSEAEPLVCKVVHFHDVTEEVNVEHETTGEDLLTELRSRPRGELWQSGEMLFEGRPVDMGAPLVEVPGFTGNPCLQFFPPMNSNGVGVGTPIAVQPERGVPLQSGGLVLEVRFYQGVEYEGAQLVVGEETTVGAFKDMIADRFGEMGRDIPRGRQHLVYSGQVKPDDALVSSFPLSSVGGVPIFQLYERQTESDHPLLPNDDDAGEASRNSTTDEDGERIQLRQAKACYLILVSLGLFVVLFAVGVTSLTTDGGGVAGYCYPSSRTWKNARCTFSQKYRAEYMNFNTSKPVVDVNYTSYKIFEGVPTDLRDEKCAQEGYEHAIVTGVKSLPELMADVMRDSNLAEREFLLGATLGEDGAWQNEKGRLVIPDSMFLSPDGKRLPGMRLVAVSPWFMLDTVYQTHFDFVSTVNVMCARSDPPAGYCSTTSPYIGEARYDFREDYGYDCREVCDGYCKTRLPTPDITAAGGCCGAKRTNGIRINSLTVRSRCECRLYKTTDVSSSGGAYGVAKVIQPAEVTAEDTVFYKYNRKKLSDDPDLREDAQPTLDDCATSCVTTKGCMTFVYHKTFETCSLYSYTPRESDQGLVSSANDVTFTTSPDNVVFDMNDDDLPIGDTDGSTQICDNKLRELLSTGGLPCSMHGGSVRLGEASGVGGSSTNVNGVAALVMSFVALCCCIVFGVVKFVVL